MAHLRSPVGLATVVAGVAIMLAAVGCDRSAETRAAFAQRRDSWTRELAGLKAQQSLLAERVQAPGAAAGSEPAARRTRAVVDGVRQSIADVEGQLAQAGERIEQEIRRGGGPGEKAIDDESARARGYLQGLGEQIGAAARQIDELARTEDGSKQATP